ncbi:MAG: D-alanine--D-alanine ligase [Candidatus Uhrbacteria bacterium]
MIRVAILLGGTSSERAVSLRSGALVKAQLVSQKDQFTVKSYDTGKKTDLMRFVKDAQAKRFNVVFNALHGTHGEDGHIQGLCELLGVPYTGSGVLASAQAMDKAVTIGIFHAAGLPVSESVLITRQAWKKQKQETLKSLKRVFKKDIVVKPNASGSSVGLFVKPARSTWEKAISGALKEDAGCLVESFVAGREFTVPVLEYKGVPRALPVIEIRTAGGVFDYQAKYHDKRTQEICPAPISEELRGKAQTYAVQAHQALGCRGYSRTDLILDANDQFWILETNTLPGLTSASLLPKSAAVAGFSYIQLLSHLIREALR